MAEHISLYILVDGLARGDRGAGGAVVDDGVGALRDVGGGDGQVGHGGVSRGRTAFASDAGIGQGA
jgi:hypothetical protein